MGWKKTCIGFVLHRLRLTESVVAKRGKFGSVIENQPQSRILALLGRDMSTTPTTTRRDFAQDDKEKTYMSYMNGNMIKPVLLVLSALLLAVVSAADIEDIVACPCEIAPLPDLRHKELTARWMVHSLNWGVLSTISSRLTSSEGDRLSIPFGNVYSFVDGTCQNSTGTPYFYGTHLDQSFKDSLVNNHASLTLSEASISSVCLSTSSAGVMKRKACQIGLKYGDPENPVCARLTLTGTLEEVTVPAEKEWALQSIFQRHSSMEQWPQDHDWVVAKLVLKDIWLIDFFGGASILDLDAYYHADDFMKEITGSSGDAEEEDKH
ncbi:Protein CREG2 [Seminavis robusta]|uniref:Protein CREG2 n=1 Tax=Seminavis robusta TaxID=568900 RepID=A0A9N8DJF4_9STRA|nr:Protein CREG2 [Seminavis robusta]|eukprot:Sro176_g077520.1 Protein CREG2 (322) ;mRNA; r:82097-83062